MNFEQKDTLYEQAKKSLIKGELVSTGENSTVAVKLEPAFLMEDEETQWTAGYVKQTVGVIAELRALL